MRSSKIKGRILAIFLTAALLVGSVSAATFSSTVYSTYAPTAVTTSISSNILTGATAAANTPVLSILGVNVTSSDAAGVLNSSSNASAPLNLIIFGSSWNESADPYLANFYYNLATQSTGGTTAYNATDYGSWTGAYTLINSAKSGPTGGVSTSTAAANTLSITVNGTTKTSNIIFFYEPDVLLGATESSYDAGLTQYNADNTNANYSPLVVGGWTTSVDSTNVASGYCMNDGTVASTEAMANGVFTQSVILDAYAYSIEKDGRYDSIRGSGETYADFALAFYFYAQGAFDGYEGMQKLTKLTYCTNLTVNGSDSYTVAAGSGRVAQYADGLGEEAEAGTYTLSQLAAAVDVVLSSSLSESEISTLEGAGITVLDNTLPSTVYGTSMQAPDNILGQAYYFALMYGSQLGITAEDVTAYFAQNIYHVSNDYVDDAVALMMGVDSVSFSCNYSSIIDSLIAAAKSYYSSSSNTSDVQWLSVELNGIEFEYTYNSTVGDYQTQDDKGNSIYSYVE